MTIKHNIQTSDDVGMQPMQADDADEASVDTDWDADPAAILEREEEQRGRNCFDQPIY